MTPRSQVLLSAIGCLGLLAVNGYFFPLALTPDSGAYLSNSEKIARIVRDGGSILELTEKFRILGYPAVLAPLKLAFGAHLFLAVYVVQAACVVTTGVMLVWTLLRLGIAFAVSAPLSLLYIAALPTMLSSFLLTDAINAALTAIAICFLVEPLFKPTHPALARVLTAGVLMGVAFFVREANQYLIVCVLPMVLVIAWQRRKLSSGLVLVLVLLAPVLIAGEAYKTFNEARFGQRFVTTGGRTVMLQALLPLAQRKPDLFDGTGDLDRTARTTLKEFTFLEIWTISNTLLTKGHDEVGLAKEAFAKYFEAWRRFPLGMVRVFLGRLRFDKQATELLNPPLAFYNNDRWRGDIEASESRRFRAALKAGDAREFIAVLPIVLGRIPSLMIFVLFFLGTPGIVVYAWRRGERIAASGLAALFISYAGYVSVYGLVNMEMRYLAGIAVIPVIGASVMLRTARRLKDQSRLERSRETP